MTDQPEDECLHCKIVQVIDEHLAARTEAGQDMQLADVADRIVEALADFILGAVPAEDRTKMLAYALESLGRALQSEGEGETRH